MSLTILYFEEEIKLQISNIQQILSMPPVEMAQWISKNYIKPLPCPKSSKEFAANNHLLGELANTYAFLSGVHVISKIMVREAKKKNLPKDEIDACIDRRDTIDEFISIIKMQYNAYSRMITVQRNADEEMRMMNE